MAAKRKPATRKKISDSQKGNTNAEKWTVEVVTAKIVQLQEYVDSAGCYIMSEACFACDIMPQRISDWRKKFSGNATVLEPLEKFKVTVGNNLYKGGLESNLNASLVSLGLKNNYGWAEKVESKAKVSGEIKIPGFGWADQ